MNTKTMKTDARRHAAIEGATIQHAALFRRMTTGGTWNLYAVPGALSGVAIYEQNEAPDYYVDARDLLVPNVHAMTAATMATRINTAWPEHEAHSVSAPYGPAQERTQ